VDDEEFRSLVRRGLFMEETLGRMGIESRFNAELRGRRGAALRERDTVSGEIRTVTATAAVPGRDLTLALDAVAQQAADRALGDGGRRGAIVAMDVRTGEVLVLASAPGFDPNDLAPPPKNEIVRHLFAPEAGNPFQNRAIASAYPLGSVFKILVGAAAIHEGTINAGTTFDCSEPIRIEGWNHTFDCWIFEHGTGHGALDITGALQRSCNIFFYRTGRTLGVEKMMGWSGRFGLGTRSGIELRGETAGLVPGPGGRWNAGDAYNLSIGQGSLLVSPLQAARLTAAIANGGRLLRPRLVLEPGWTPEGVDLGIAAGALDTVRKGMWNVVNEEGGTAHASGMSRFNAGGKTGTAQAGAGRPNHAWFAGYFPHEKPRYAMCVFVEHGGKGSQAAAPLAVPVAEALMRDATPPAEQVR
jgi:penicillin-binding protein 2